jgi:deoxyadenosine kinase
MMQLYLLQKRFSQHQHIIWSLEVTPRQVVQDRTIYEDTIFAQMLRDDGYMCPRDYKTYLSTFRGMTHYLQRPDIVLYLDVSPRMAYDRIQSRGRTSEKSITLEYLSALWAGYESWYAAMRDTLNIVRLPWSAFEEPKAVAAFVENEIGHRGVLPSRWGAHL